MIAEFLIPRIHTFKCLITFWVTSNNQNKLQLHSMRYFSSYFFFSFSSAFSFNFVYFACGWTWCGVTFQWDLN